VPYSGHPGKTEQEQEDYSNTYWIKPVGLFRED
jgi:hypothetical protein